VSATQVGDLITDGVYRYSRNPQYLGWLAVLAGSSVAGRSAVALALSAAYAAVVNDWITVEERHLEATFGQTYRHYRQATHRWLGRTPGTGA